MKTLLKFFSLVTISAALLVSLAFFAPPFSDNKTPQLIAKANLFNLKYPQEKVYLHLDRSSYWASDDIWFKAYLKDSPITNCNLYVELLNSTGRVVDRKMFWAQNGLSYGDFRLTDTIPSGVYQIRAYTHWMRNFDEDWFFRKDIVVINLADRLPESESNKLNERKIDIQFFPEGGTFVEGLESTVAFKVADQNGKGLDVEGRIVDDLGNEIVEMKSNFKGIGHFKFQPREGRRYKAQVKVAGSIDRTVELPVPKTEGVALAVNVQDASVVSIKVNKKSVAGIGNSPNEYTLVGQTKGAVFFRKNIALGADAFSLDIQKKELPNGIVQFTLFDQEAIPVCERLVFINHFDFIQVDVFPDKADYLPRERVQLDLEAYNRDGMPILSNLSMSVYNPDAQLKSEEYPNNILTHFLLGTELKGMIEEPAYYFKDDSLSTVVALDNLMLTHGYRHFEWKEIQENKYPEIAYPAEECIQVRGMVKSILVRKPLPDATVKMMSVRSLFSFYEQTSDSLGRFVFSDLYFNDTIQFSLQALNKKGKQNTEIELDYSSSISPLATYLPATYQYIGAKPVNTTTYLSELGSDLISRKWRLSDTILLGDIEIRAAQAKKDDGHIRIYAHADFVYKVTKQDNVMANIFEMIDGRIPGVRLEDKTFFIRGNAGGALLLLDGVPVDPDFITSLSINSFDKIEVVKYAPLLGSQGNNGAIFFYLKRGQKQEYIKTDALGMKSVTVEGYALMRKFYSPAYESQTPAEIKDDYRSTLYWDPLVRTDSLGRAAVAFYNSDQPGEVKVIVEGVTADGKLCRGVGKYHVRP